MPTSVESAGAWNGWIEYGPPPVPQPPSVLPPVAKKKGEGEATPVPPVAREESSRHSRPQMRQGQAAPPREAALRLPDRRSDPRCMVAPRLDRNGDFDIAQCAADVVLAALVPDHQATVAQVEVPLM